MGKRKRLCACPWGWESGHPLKLVSEANPFSLVRYSKRNHGCIFLGIQEVVSKDDFLFKPWL